MQGATHTTQECQAALAKMNKLFSDDKSPFAEFATKLSIHFASFTDNYITVHWLSSETKVPVDKRKEEQAQLTGLLKELIPFVDALAVARIAKHAASGVAQDNASKLPPQGMAHYEHLNAISRESGTRLNGIAVRAHAAFATLQGEYSALRKAYDTAVSAMKTAGVVDHLVKINGHLNPNTTSFTVHGAPITAEDQKLLTDLQEKEVPQDQAKYVSSLTRAILYKNDDAGVHQLHCKSLETCFTSGESLEIHELLTLLEYAKAMAEKEASEKSEEEAKESPYATRVEQVQREIATALKEVDHGRWVAQVVNLRTLSTEELQAKLLSLNTSRSEVKLASAARKRRRVDRSRRKNSCYQL